MNKDKLLIIIVGKSQVDSCLLGSNIQVGQCKLEIGLDQDPVWIFPGSRSRILSRLL